MGIWESGLFTRIFCTKTAARKTAFGASIGTSIIRPVEEMISLIETTSEASRWNAHQRSCRVTTSRRFAYHFFQSLQALFQVWFQLTLYYNVHKKAPLIPSGQRKTYLGIMIITWDQTRTKTGAQHIPFLIT